MEGVFSPFSQVRVKIPWSWLRVWLVSLGVWGIPVITSWTYKLPEETKERGPFSSWLCHLLLRRGSVSHWPDGDCWDVSWLLPKMTAWRGDMQPMEGQATRCPGLEGRIRSVLQKKITAHDKNLVYKSSLWKKKTALNTKNQHPNGMVPYLSSIPLVKDERAWRIVNGRSHRNKIPNSQDADDLLCPITVDFIFSEGEEDTILNET